MPKYFWHLSLFLLFFGAWEVHSQVVVKIIVVVINKEKYSIQDFANFIRKFSPNKKINASQVEEFLSIYIGDKLIEKEIEKFWD